jgi:hypothetical protein
MYMPKFSVNTAGWKPINPPGTYVVFSVVKWDAGSARVRMVDNRLLHGDFPEQREGSRPSHGFLFHM